MRTIQAIRAPSIAGAPARNLPSRGQQMPSNCRSHARGSDGLELVLVDAERADARFERLPRNAQHHRGSMRAGDPTLRRRERRLDSLALAIAGGFRLCIPPQPGSVDGERLAIAKDDGALDDVLQFADISGPVVCREELQRVRVDPPDLPARGLREAANQVFDEHADLV